MVERQLSMTSGQVIMQCNHPARRKLKLDSEATRSHGYAASSHPPAIFIDPANHAIDVLGLIQVRCRRIVTLLLWIEVQV